MPPQEFSECEKALRRDVRALFGDGQTADTLMAVFYSLKSEKDQREQAARGPEPKPKKRVYRKRPGPPRRPTASEITE